MAATHKVLFFRWRTKLLVIKNSTRWSVYLLFSNKYPRKLSQRCLFSLYNFICCTLFKKLYGKTSFFGQVKQFANFECQLKIYESLYFGRTSFIINVHVVKDWIISFITSERTIPLPKNKNRISSAQTTLLWPVFVSMANKVPIFGHIGFVISPDSTFIRFVLKLA